MTRQTQNFHFGGRFFKHQYKFFVFFPHFFFENLFLEERGMKLSNKIEKRKDIENKLHVQNDFLEKILYELVYGSKYLLCKQFVHYYNQVFKTFVDFEKYNIVWDGIFLSVENHSQVIFLYGPNGGQEPCFYQYAKPHFLTRNFKLWEFIQLNEISQEKFPYDLYPDALCCILKFLPIKDRLNCRSVSKHWNRVTNMERNWKGLEFKKFVKSMVFINTLNVERILVPDGILEIQTIARAWAFENGIQNPFIEYVKAEEVKKKRRMDIMHRNEIKNVSIRTVDHRNVRVYMAGIVNQMAVCWINQYGELKFVSKRPTLERFKEMMFNYANFVLFQ